MRRGKKDRYVLPYQCQKPKYSKGGRMKDIISHIRNKVEGSDKVLKEMKEDISTLNQRLTCHSVSIKILETQMGQMYLNKNPTKQGGLPSDTIFKKLKNEV